MRLIDRLKGWIATPVFFAISANFEAIFKELISPFRNLGRGSIEFSCRFTGNKKGANRGIEKGKSKNFATGGHIPVIKNCPDKLG